MASVKRKSIESERARGSKTASRPASRPIHANKKSPTVKMDVDEGSEDLEADLAGNLGGTNGSHTPQDPMIDPQGSVSSGSEDEEQPVSAGQEEENGSPNGGASIRQPSRQSEDHVPTAGPSRPPRRQDPYRPPTIQEMDLLHSAHQSGTTAHTTFQLQLEALLFSTLLPKTPQPALKTLLSTIHERILSLPTLPPLSPLKAVKRMKGVSIPFPGPEEFSPFREIVGEGDEGVQWRLGWEKPEEVVVGGSWGVCGGYRKGKGEMGDVNVVLVMPQSLLSPKDRMSYRYFHKRAYYLAIILEAVKEMTQSENQLAGGEVEWEYDGGDERRPIVVIKLGKEQGLKYRTTIRIHASFPQSTFPLSFLYPSKSLIRNADIPLETPTPLYTNSILHDMLHKSHLVHINRLSQQLSPERTVDSFLALWRIWAARRGIRRQRGGSGWFASMLLGWVVDGGMVGSSKENKANARTVPGLGKGLGFWGGLRAAWEFLAHTDFEKTPVYMRAQEGVPRSEFTKCFQDVVVDCSGSLNIFAEWEKGDVQLIRHHARQTLALLEETSVDRFAEVFLRDQTVGMVGFDDFAIVNISLASEESDLAQRSERPPKQDRLISSIASVIRRGLSDRAELVQVSPLMGAEDRLSIGIIYDSAQATRVLDIGPASERTDEVNAYQELWGEKAELRRFKDGSITESVVWDVARPEDAALIPSRIVRWLLHRHFAIHETAVHGLSADPRWLSLVQTPSLARDAISVAGSEKLGFRPIMTAYEDLYKLLKSIDSELPLSILNVAPSSDMLRYSSTFVPHPIDLARYPSAPDCLKYIPKVDIVMQFESSPRWPDDLAAIQKVKLALFHKLAGVIKARLPSTNTAVVLESNISDIEDASALEVVLPQGVVFHIRIFHERERLLLDRVIEGEKPTFGTALPQPPRKLAVAALGNYMHRFVHRPQHHSAIAPLHHRFPSYSGATRLLKRWISAHMLSLHIIAEVIEIIMARIYLDPGARQTPASGTSGFLRAVELLSLWDWRTIPLIVPIVSVTRDSASASGRIYFPPEQRTEVVRLFEQRRGRDHEVKHAAWVVATEHDLEGTRWTNASPSRVIASRVTALAKASLATIRQACEVGSLNPISLFTTPLTDYDVLLHLSPSLLPIYAQAIHPNEDEWESKLRFKNIQHLSAYGTQVKVDFDPASSFVSDIVRLFGESVLVFHDVHGGSVIGLLWNPARLAPRTLKAFVGYSSMPAENEGMVVLDKEGVLAGIARLGKGLVDRIERVR